MTGSLSRRDLLRGGAALAGSGALVSLGYPSRVRETRNAPRIAIVGAGLAGLACADRLASKGCSATIYEANPVRIGGRCWSARNTFPGQVAELGGEFLNTSHKTMIAYARTFGLRLEDLTKSSGEEVYRFFGQNYTEADVVAEWRELSRRMQPDLKSTSGAPTFQSNTEADRLLDHTDLATYLATRAGDLPLIRAVLEEIYVAEYGLEAHRQSSLNLMYFIKLDRRRKFHPLGVFSDERYHVVEGNDRIAEGIANRIPGTIERGAQLERLSRNGLGEYELKFVGVGTPVRADHVVLALPFSTLRTVDLDASLNLTPDKRRAIATLGYGTNAKTMIGFQGRPWASNGADGTAYSDLPEVQLTWETSPTTAVSTSVLTDYAGGDRGATMDRRSLDRHVVAFLRDLDLVFPGSAAAASTEGRSYRAVREVWTSNPLARGSYTCYTPGQFTTVCGLEALPAERLKFAGEHTDSFYEWQGFMEGACNSGIRAADEVLSDIRSQR